jgi:hypothetical protein
MVRTAPGRVEVAAQDGAAAHALAALAEETWRHLAEPFGLPEEFTTPLYVRLAPQPGPAFAAAVEPGGVVTLWIHPSETGGRSRPELRRALIHGLLWRLAVAWHGPAAMTAGAGWLEVAAGEWCAVREQPARLDAWKWAAGRRPAPAWAEAAGAGETAAPDAVRAAASFGLMQWLYAEGARAGEWRTFLRLLLAGQPVADAVAAAYPGRFATETERELWWQTGWHHLRRQRALPGLDIGESRQEVEQRARFVFAPDGETDEVVPLREVLALADDAVTAAELRRRAEELDRLAGRLHPFYRNAGLSLAEALRAGPGPAARREAGVARFDEDWRNGRELEEMSRRILDERER